MWIKWRNLWVLFGRLCPASTSAVWSAMLELAAEPPLESLLLQVVLLLLVTPQVTKQSISQRYICGYITIMWMHSWACTTFEFLLQVQISCTSEIKLTFFFSSEFSLCSHLWLNYILFFLYSQGGGEEGGEEGRVRGVRRRHGLWSLWLKQMFFLYKNTIKV